MKLSGKLQLILIFAIAVGTPVAATILYFVAPPEGTTNLGELLEPRQLPAAVLEDTAEDSWRMMILGDANCGDSCKERLCVMRQVRLTRMQDIMRIERLWLVDGEGSTPKALEMAPTCGRELAAARSVEGAVDILDGVLVVREGDKVISSLPTTEKGTRPDRFIYIIDPQGNLMMRYPDDAAVKDIAKDLRRLLRLSKTVG